VEEPARPRTETSRLVTKHPSSALESPLTEYGPLQGSNAHDPHGLFVLYPSRDYPNLGSRTDVEWVPIVATYLGSNQD